MSDTFGNHHILYLFYLARVHSVGLLDSARSLKDRGNTCVFFL